MAASIERIFSAISETSLGNSPPDIDGIISAIQDTGIAVRELRFNGLSVLDAAIRANCEKLIRFIVSQGAELNVWEGDPFRCTPLGIACKFGTEEIVELLIELGSDINLQPDNGASPAICQCAGSKSHFLILDLLLKKGADVELCSISRGGTPSSNALAIAAKLGNLAAVRSLLEHKANPNIVFPSGTPLAHAAEAGYLEIAKLLLAYGAEKELVAQKNPGFPLAHRTPLELAHLKKRSAIIQLFSSPSAPTSKNDTSKKTQSIDTLIRRIDRRREGASTKNLARLKKKFGTISDWLLELLKFTDGEPSEGRGLFPPPSPFESLNGRFYLLSVDEIIANAENTLESKLIPFAQNGAGDFLACSSTSQGSSSAILIFQHELGEARIIATSFDDWLQVVLK